MLCIPCAIDRCVGGKNFFYLLLRCSAQNYTRRKNSAPEVSNWKAAIKKLQCFVFRHDQLAISSSITTSFIPLGFCGVSHIWWPRKKNKNKIPRKLVLMFSNKKSPFECVLAQKKEDKRTLAIFLCLGGCGSNTREKITSRCGSFFFYCTGFFMNMKISFIFFLLSLTSKPK